MRFSHFASQSGSIICALVLGFPTRSENSSLASTEGGGKGVLALGVKDPSKLVNSCCSQVPLSWPDTKRVAERFGSLHGLGSDWLGYLNIQDWVRFQY